MTQPNQGFKTEKEMMKWFKGSTHNWDCVDFQTKNCLYEVKSCRLFLNSNRKRKHTTIQLGRFFIRNENHRLLKSVSEKENKIPKYIFAIVVGNQKIWKVVSWDNVDKLLNKIKKTSAIKMNKIFKKELGLE